MGPVDDGFRRLGPDPFALPLDRRDHTRRLRGRLVAPVTVWTAYGTGGMPTGISVSSVLVVEGDPPCVIGLIGPVSEFWEAVQYSRRFVVHILGADQTRIADQFAARYPGDPFDGLAACQSDAGPILDVVGTRAACELSGYMEAGYFLLLRGVIGDMTMAKDEVAPLVHYRGRYVTTAVRRTSKLMRDKR